MSLIATIQSLKLRAAIALSRRGEFSLDKLYTEATNRPASWLRAQVYLRHYRQRAKRNEDNDRHLWVRWILPSDSSWTGIRLLLSDGRSTDHHAVLEMGTPLGFIELSYIDRPLVKQSLRAELFAIVHSRGLLDKDSYFGWTLSGGEVMGPQTWRNRAFYFADLLLGKETVTQLETKEEVFAVTMPGGEAIPVRVLSKFMMRSRPRGKRSQFTVYERNYGPSAEQYQIGTRSGLARHVAAALGSDHGDAIVQLGRVPWEPQPWHCAWCRGTGMMPDWSKPCGHKQCSGGVMMPDYFMGQAISYATSDQSAQARWKDPLPKVLDYLDRAAGAARFHGHLQTMPLILKSRTSALLAMRQDAKASALEAMLAFVQVRAVLQAELAVHQFDALERDLYLDVLATNVERAVPLFDAILSVQKSPMGALWVTHDFVRRPMPTPCEPAPMTEESCVAAAQNLQHDVELAARLEEGRKHQAATASATEDKYADLRQSVMEMADRYRHHHHPLNGLAAGPEAGSGEVPQ